jgi:hypothetical protein
MDALPTPYPLCGESKLFGWLYPVKSRQMTTTPMLVYFKPGDARRQAGSMIANWLLPETVARSPALTIMGQAAPENKMASPGRRAGARRSQGLALTGFDAPSALRQRKSGTVIPLPQPTHPKSDRIPGRRQPLVTEDQIE